MRKPFAQALSLISIAVLPVLIGGCGVSQLTQYSSKASDKLAKEIGPQLLDDLPPLDAKPVAADPPAASPAQLVCEGVPMPTMLQQLNQSDVYSSNVSLATKASLSLYGFSGEMGKKDILVSAYFLKFKDYKCGNTTKRALVGIRLYVHASDLKVKISAPTLGAVAAAAELGLAKSEYRLRTFGLNPSDFYLSIPSAEFNVDTYSKVIAGYDKIVNTLKDTTPIDPLVEDIAIP